MKSLHTLSLAACVTLASPGFAQTLLAVESTNDRVLLLDAATGAVINPNYIDLIPAGSNLPIEALVVGSEIWVTDQSADKLMRFTLDGTTYLGDIGGGAGGLDNVRGAEYIGGVVYVCNSGTANGAPGNSLVMFDSAGTNLGNFPVASPFDVIPFQGDLLVSDSGGFDVRRYTTAGAFVSIFHNGGGAGQMGFPEQLTLNATGNVLVASFLGTPGVYELDATTGAQVGFWSAADTRGVQVLTSGQYIYGRNTGFYTLDPVSGISTPVHTGVVGRYITYFGTPTPPAIVAFCSGDGSLTDHTTPCPCGNNGAPGNGCGHSFDANGANLSASGVPANDDVVLHSQFEPVSSFTLMMQHENTADTVFHDGVLCAGNPLIRLRGRAAVGGEAFFPNSNFAQDSTTTLSQRGAVFPGQGVRRYYAAWYRNASTTFCPPATANVTNGIQIDW